MSSLVHELTLLQEREGWLSEAALRDLARALRVPLHRLESLSTFYTHFRRTPPPVLQVDVCRDLPCALAGGETACERLHRAAAGRDQVEVRPVSCLGRCDAAPAAAVGTRLLQLRGDGDLLADVEADGLAAPEPPRPDWGEADLYSAPGERYTALRRGLAERPDTLIEQLEESGLRGMGGAGFPTGRKWSLVAGTPAPPRYVVCNADESEPGTFKDREILRTLPHLVIEGMALAAHCVGAERGFVFIRHEYGPERRALEAALHEARASGALDPKRFDVEIFVSPGGYILGEETALLECMEDRRGEPRNKPPYPGTSGLWGRPTLMNNVETLAHATAILHRGVGWWKGLGRPGFAGHKFISVSGDVAEPGVHLLPFGSTLGELLERCGGMQDGRRLGAVAPGGASSAFLGPEALDVPIDFHTLEEAGSMLGSGAAIFLGEDRDLLAAGLNVTRFFRNESCGKCVPCRVGTEKAVKLVEESGAVGPGERDLLEQLNHTLLRTSICGLGQVALAPLLSVLRER